MKKIFSIIILPVAMIAIFLSYAFSANTNSSVSHDVGWEKQLKEMNYLIIKISSVNIINGLFFTDTQAEKLNKLSSSFQSGDLPSLDTTGNSSFELVNIRRVYIKLLEKLLKKESVSDSLKNQVNAARIVEAEIIKKSLIVAQDPGYSGTGCQQCHASPALFSHYLNSSKELEIISPEKRAEIDKAHSLGLFGEKGMVRLWNMKAAADSILTDGQKYIMKNFRCCLVPPGDLSDPTNIGQAFVSNDWINYFRATRKLSDSDWKKYNSSFILPLDTLLRATLPGIKTSESKIRLRNAEAIIDKARKMDEIDFELQKENLCLKMKEALQLTALTGETIREADTRQFITAMFLLFNGNADLYEKISRH
jgi:hypothetical protein